LNLRELECFLAVADALHFGRAADHLHLAQPTVSESVRRLERCLGGDLFDRSTRNVALTELGKAFLEEARYAYQQVEAAYETGRRLARRRSDQLVIAHAPFEDERLLVALTADLRRREADVNVVLEELETVDQLEALRHRRVDAALAWGVEAQPEVGTMTISSCGYVALVAEGDPLSRDSALTAERIASEPLITWPRASHPVMYDKFAAAMDATGKPWSLVATASGVASLVSRVISSQGVGVIPSVVIRRRQFDGVRVIPLVDQDLRLERALVWSKACPHPLMATLSRVVVRLFRDADRPTAVAAAG